MYPMYGRVYSNRLIDLKELSSHRLHCALRSETKTTTQNGKTTGSNSCFLAFQIINVDSLKYTTLLGSSRLGLPRFLFGLASIRYGTSINNRRSDPLRCLGRGGLAPNLGPGPIHRERAPKIKLSLLESPKFFVAPLFYTGLKGYWNIAIYSN